MEKSDLRKMVPTILSEFSYYLHADIILHVTIRKDKLGENPPGFHQWFIIWKSHSPDSNIG